MPAIYDLANRGLLPPGFSLTGFARRDWANEDFAQVVHDSVKEHARTEFLVNSYRRANYPLGCQVEIVWHASLRVQTAG